MRLHAPPFTAVLVAALVLALIQMVAVKSAHAGSTCAPAGEWTIPGGGQASAAEVLSSAAKSAVVLLGETHDDADHHRWQLQTIATLSAMRGRSMLGFEMFPRRVQGALDRWVAGDLAEPEFLAASDWRKVWNVDAQLYMPIFQFARINRVPMLALNVDSDLVKAINRGGLQSLPMDRREGIGAASPANPAYLDRLFLAYSSHVPQVEGGRKPARSDEAFHHFVEAQQFWDRAMAQGIADALKRDPKALVIGVMGAEHVARGYGVAHQLAGLGVTSVTTLLPWDAETDCRRLQPGLATAVFGLPEAKESASRPRLGIRIEPASDGVRVVEVGSGSLADISGLRANDVLTEAAGRALKTPAELIALVAGMTPGTWLPLKVRRQGQGEAVDLLAKFPPAAP